MFIHPSSYSTSAQEGSRSSDPLKPLGDADRCAPILTHSTASVSAEGSAVCVCVCVCVCVWPSTDYQDSGEDVHLESKLTHLSSTWGDTQQQMAFPETPTHLCRCVRRHLECVRLCVCVCVCVCVHLLLSVFKNLVRFMEVFRGNHLRTIYNHYQVFLTVVLCSEAGEGKPPHGT